MWAARLKIRKSKLPCNKTKRLFFRCKRIVSRVQQQQFLSDPIKTQKTPEPIRATEAAGMNK
jgi:hypothetical protein